MSNRKITKRQFSDGTTVDGTRIDAALQDTTEYLNNVPAGDLATRYTQTQHVAGSTAQQKVAQKHQAPWLRYQNTTSDRNGSTGDIAHPFRIKGTHSVPGAVWAAPNDETKWVWTSTLYIEDPCVVDAIDMMWQKYTGTFGSGNNANPQLDFIGAAGPDFLSVQGIQCTIAVEDPNATEDPIRNSVVTQLRNVYLGAETLSTDATLFPAASGMNMSPAVSNGLPSDPSSMAVDQLWYQRRNMQVHIPANSRLSVSIVLDGQNPAGNKLDYDSYMRGAPNLVLTLLEPLR